MIASKIPAMPYKFNFSLKIKIPIKIVANKPKTDHIVPTIESWFFSKIAGNQKDVPAMYAAKTQSAFIIFGSSANFFDQNSPIAKAIPEKINQII